MFQRKGMQTKHFNVVPLFPFEVIVIAVHGISSDNCTTKLILMVNKAISMFTIHALHGCLQRPFSADLISLYHSKNNSVILTNFILFEMQKCYDT